MDFETIGYASPLHRDIMTDIKFGTGIRPYAGAMPDSIYGTSPMKARAQRDEYVQAQQVKKEKGKKAAKAGIGAALVAIATAIVFKKTNLLSKIKPVFAKLGAKLKPVYTKVVDKVKPLYTKVADKVKPLFAKVGEKVKPLFAKLTGLFKKAPKV